jgi:hypothetical protein
MLAKTMVVPPLQRVSEDEADDIKVGGETSFDNGVLVLSCASDGFRDIFLLELVYLCFFWPLDTLSRLRRS